MGLINISSSTLKPVPPSGPIQCLMAICGQAPADIEEIEGYPFAGPSGNILNSKLHMNGIARQQCYITNLSKHRPGTWWNYHQGIYKGKTYSKPENTNDFSIFWNGKYPSEYLLECKESLLQELCTIETNVILACGGDVLWALTGHKEISKYRGSILSTTLPNGKVVKVVGCWHPAAIYKPLKKVSPGAMAHIIQMDIAKAKAQSGFPELRLPQRNLIIKPDFNIVREFILDHAGKDKVAYDIETAPGSITCLSLAFNKNEAISIPTTLEYWGSWTVLLQVLKVINFILTKPNTLKIAQFMDYDFLYLFRFFAINITKPWFDNAVAQHCISGNQLIDTLEGQRQIKDLVGKDNVWVWSWKDNKPFPAKAKLIKKTRDNAELVRVHLWRRTFPGIEKTYIDCTPDHKFLVNNEWIEAKNLKSGASLTKVSIQYGGERNYININNNRLPVSRYVWESINKTKIKDRQIIHHINNNCKDDRPENLSLAEDFLHHSFHSDNYRLKEYIKLFGPWNKGNLGGVPVDENEIKELLKSGLTQEEVGSKLGCSRASISQYIKTYGLDTLSKSTMQSQRRKREQEDLFNELDELDVDYLYISGMSMTELSKTTGKTHKTIKKYLVNRKINFRSISESVILSKQSDFNCKVINIENLDIKEDVYCIEIEDTNCFSCNGVIIHNCSFPELPKGHDFLCSVCTDEPYYKDELKIWLRDISDMERLYTYNARDAATEFEVYEDMDDTLDFYKVRHTFDYMMELMEPLLCIMLDGIRFNKEAAAKHREVQLDRLVEHEEILKDKYGDFNPRSPKQILELLNTLNIQPIMKDGKPSTNKKALEKLAKKNPELASIIDVKNAGKFTSSYIDVDLDPIDNKFRFKLNQTRAVTGRLSASESSFWGVGTNSENIPKSLRDMFIPDEGMIFTEPDLKGAEAVVVAYLSEDPLLMKLFKDGWIEPETGFRFTNVHCFTAYQIWHVTEQAVKDERKRLDPIGKDTETMYFRGKKTRHSGNYLGTWMTLSEELKITAAEAKALLRRFHSASPNINQWHKEVEMQLKNTRTLTTCLGRRRTFFGLWGPDLLRAAVAYEPQETVVHVLNIGLTRFYNEVCKKYKEVSIKNQVHDSMLIQHPLEMKEFIYSELERLMKVDLRIKGRDFYIPIDIKSGKNWRDLE